MTTFTVAPKEMEITAKEDILGVYQFGSGVAKHHFCKLCGIYSFHQTMRKAGHYRINIACLSAVNPAELTVEFFDGAAI